MTVNTQRLSYYVEKAGYSLPDSIVKRDGTRARFDVNRIENAVTRCFSDCDSVPPISAAEVAEGVARAISVRSGETGNAPTVEQVQDAVEFQLHLAGAFEAAKQYILYREQRASERKMREIPDDVRAAFAQDKQFLRTPSQLFNFYDKYSRYNWDLGRRETWVETVDRVVDHLRWEVDQHKPGAISNEIFERIHDAILNMRIMPSMRLLAMAGEAARRNSMALYNCSYLPVKDLEAFSEALTISMAGCGVGFSVESEYVEQLPKVKRQKKNQEIPTHFVADSTEGWAEAIHVGLDAWFNGRDVHFDVSGVRPAGAPLRTKGGRASGPGPLTETLKALRTIVLARQGTTLRTTDAYLMMVWVGEAAVQGGVRRTAMICLFDWDDHEMRTFKDGTTPDVARTGDGRDVRWNSNNSAVWPEDVTDVDIMQQMLDMVKAYSGEPGIFSRVNANKSRPKRRKAAKFGTNPCGEIVLRPYEFCNLTQAVSRPGDTEDDLTEKVELATIVGIIQSLSTRFPGLRDEWKQNCEEERLLGVDLTAQHDCELLRHGAPRAEQIRRDLSEYAVAVATDYAGRLGINVPAAVTTNKPAGNSTELVNAFSNGINMALAECIIRRMTVGTHTPVFKVLRSQGAPMEPAYGSTPENATKWIASFVKAAPEGTPTKETSTAIDQLEFWLLNKEHWTEHNPSCTINYRPEEVVDMVAWVVKHKDRIGGLSFLPHTDAIYAQMPLEAIDRATFERLDAEFPDIDYSQIYAFELDDMTTAAQELACFAGSCEV